MNKILERQGLHLLGFVLIGAILYWATQQFPSRLNTLWGLSAGEWIAVSWILVGLSQAWVAFFWRLELHGNRISARLGKNGFRLHVVGYVVLFAARFLTFVPIALATAFTTKIPLWVNVPLLVISTPLILWSLHGGVVYFGLERLAGIDHFDPAYRGGDLEVRGIYALLPNAAYSVGLLFFFHPGLVLHSPLALIVAAAQFAMVWVHYFCTEQPDLRHIYGAQ